MVYNLCFISSKDFWNLVFTGISAISSVGAYFIAKRIANEISFKKDLKKKQLETVFELVVDLQNLMFYFSYNFENPPSGKKILAYSIDNCSYFFALEKKEGNLLHEVETENTKLAISEDFLYTNPIFKYSKNPFLPVPIAMALNKIHPKGGKTVKYIKQTDIIYISDNRDYQKQEYIIEISKCYSNLENLFGAVEQLRKSIFDWLDDHGANDLNIIKPINLENYPN
jgi:hypothetical protein